MAYSVPLTAVSGAQLTAAQWNASVRDNILESGPAKITAAGQLLVGNAANSLAARSVAAAVVTGGSQSTASSTYVDLTTVGPSVTVTTGTAVLVCLTSYIANSTANAGGLMGFAVDGVVPGNIRPLRLLSHIIGARNRASAVLWHTGLSVGSHVFKAMYATIGGGTADFDEREIAVLPLN